MILLISASVLLVSAALCVVFYGQFSDTVSRSLRGQAEAFAGLEARAAIEALGGVRGGDMRVSVILPGGEVSYDNSADAGSLPGHLDREEVREAFAVGIGESRRFSDTLRTETAYCAVRLADGNVLRLAVTSSSVLGVFVRSLPVVLGIVLLVTAAGYALAGRLTRRIVEPLNSADPAGELSAPYDELAPFLRTIAEQRGHIARQLSDLTSRSATITAIMDNINEGIILTDGRGVILSANRSVLRIFEKDASMDGKNIVELMREISFSELVRAAIAGEPGEMGMERAGRVYRVYLSHVGGGGAIILFLDITEKARSEKLRREFTANVSHELKTPLTSIYGSAEMLLGGMIQEGDKQSFYGQIKGEAGRLIALIQDILMLSKLDEGGGAEHFASVDLPEVAREAAEALRRGAGENGVAVSVFGEGVRMRGNRSLLYEMFYNLMDNAVKYNRPGGSVDVRIAESGGAVRVEVADTGIGIPKEAQGQVFERFFRVDRSRSKKTGGTGLGLAIVKHIVLVHGGRIELSSQLGKGTTVTAAFRAE